LFHRNPHESYFPYLMAVIADFSNEKASEIEKWTWAALQITPDFLEARKLWKKARTLQSKSFFSDLPLEKKQEIYRKYRNNKTDSFIQNFLIENRKRESDSTIGNMMRAYKQSYIISQESTQSNVQTANKISVYEIELIVNEAELHSWYLEFASLSEVKSKVSIRDCLLCAYCNENQPAPYWPEGGSYVPFYGQNAEKAMDEPGAYHLPILCPYCEKTWYIVWDESPPDPVGFQYIRHIERVISQSHSHRRFFSDFISDNVLGKVVRFVDHNIENAITGEDINPEKSFVFENVFHLVSYFPIGSLDQIQSVFPNGYMEHIDLLLRDHTPENILNVKHFCHWIFCLAPDNDHSIAQMTFLPVFSAPLLPMLPTELMTEQEFNRYIEMMAGYIPEYIEVSLTLNLQEIQVLKQQIKQLMVGFGTDPSDHSVGNTSVGIDAGDLLHRSNGTLVTLSGHETDNHTFTFKLTRNPTAGKRAKILMFLTKMGLDTYVK
jgi:hypothetical protein